MKPKHEFEAVINPDMYYGYRIDLYRLPRRGEDRRVASESCESLWGAKWAARRLIRKQRQKDRARNLRIRG